MKDITWEIYAKKQYSLYKETENKKLIYLDLNYWIEFLKLLNNLECRPYTKELYELINVLVDRQKIAIPISDVLFNEIFKNYDDYKYTSIVKLMENFSNNICFVNSLKRSELELLFCLRITLEIPEAEFLLKKAIWTKPFFLMKEELPYHSSPIISKKESEEIRIKFLDKLWETELSDIFLTLSKELREKLNPSEFQKEVTHQLKEGRTKHKHEVSNFENLVKSEIFNTLELYSDKINEYLDSYFETYQLNSSRMGDALLSKNRQERPEFLLFVLTETIYETKKYDVFPSLSIGSLIHSIKRWKFESKYNDNDIFDIHHAEVALPYCDYFLTERTLKNLIKDNLLRLDSIFKCKVIHDMKESYDELYKLNN